MNYLLIKCSTNEQQTTLHDTEYEARGAYDEALKNKAKNDSIYLARIEFSETRKETEIKVPAGHFFGVQ